MTTALERLILDVGVKQTQLILIVDSTITDRQALLYALEIDGLSRINVGLQLGKRLAETPIHKRSFMAVEYLIDLVDAAKQNGPVVLEHIEILFEPSLQLNPIEILKRIAHSNCVITAWPGELRGNRLSYADNAHPEHRDFPTTGATLFHIKSIQDIQE